MLALTAPCRILWTGWDLDVVALVCFFMMFDVVVSRCAQTVAFSKENALFVNEHRELFNSASHHSEGMISQKAPRFAISGNLSENVR